MIRHSGMNKAVCNLKGRKMKNTQHTYLTRAIILIAAACTGLLQFAQADTYTGSQLTDPAYVDIFQEDWGGDGHTRWGGRPFWLLNTGTNSSAGDPPGPPGAYAVLTLSTYNYTVVDPAFMNSHKDDYKNFEPGKSMKGTQVRSKAMWSLDQNHKALTFVSSIALPQFRTPNYVPAFFPYADDGIIKQNKDYAVNHNEIDFELLTRLLVANRLWTNVFRDAAADDHVGKAAQVSATPKKSWSEFNSYKLVWSSGKVRWLLNNTSIRLEADPATGKKYTPNPAKPMLFLLNIWYPGNSWGGKSSAFAPAPDSEHNQNVFMYVDNVKVVGGKTVKGKGNPPH